MKNAIRRRLQEIFILSCAACAAVSVAPAQTGPAPCSPPLCVTRTDDAPNPAPGMLRYAIAMAPAGAVIAFDPAMNGKTIQLDASAPNRHIRIERDVVIQGPGANLLAISGENRTRIFFISAGAVWISGVTLANGLAKGGDGAGGSGGGGGGGGAAGMGGAIFLKSGSLTLSGVALVRNRAVGGNGGSAGGSLAAGNGGAGAGFGTADLLASGNSVPPGSAAGGPEPDGAGGRGGGSELGGSAGGAGGFGAGGGGGGCVLIDEGKAGGAGGANGFGGGMGGPGATVDLQGDGPPAGGGAGGAGLGGAVFVSSGTLRLIDAAFVENASVAGLGGQRAAGGVARGGALFLCAEELCGAPHAAAAVYEGASSFRGNAADTGADRVCPGRDDTDVCGILASATVARLSVRTPGAALPGAPFKVSLTALDANGIPVFTYSGKVRLKSSDPDSVLPAVVDFSGGEAAFFTTLRRLGAHTITAVDAADGSIQGSSSEVVVVAN